MQLADVGIIGGGLAGLYAANQLDSRKITYQLFESKTVCGGRVGGIPVLRKSVENANEQSPASPLFYDMGPAWVFSHHQLVQSLVRDMGLSLFSQYTSGDVLYQFENIKDPRRITTAQKETLYRIQNGTYALIRALLKNIPTKNVHTQHKVTSVTKVGDKWRVSAVIDNTEVHTVCKHVIFALPPRIIARDFSKAGWMNNILQQQLVNSQTWMSGQAKVIVTYATPFWRDQGLSGQAFSQVGPLVEIHDACCSPDEGFALFGFVGIPATQRLGIPQKELKQSCIKQLANIFGHDAYRFEKCFVKDWAKDKDVCTGQDLSEGSRHPHINMQTCDSALLGENLYLAGSEFADADAGYLEGALRSVNTAIEKLEGRL